MHALPFHAPQFSNSIAITSLPPHPAPAAPTRLGLALAPRDVLRRWPTDTPLAAIYAGGSSAATHRRVTILAAPRDTLIHTPTPSSHWPDFLRTSPRAITTASASAPPLPFTSGWIGFISYDAGRLIEPHAQFARGARDDRHWPAMAWARCDTALVFDHASRSWFAAGDCTQLLVKLNASPTLVAAPEVGALSSATGRDAFTRDVARVLEYLRAGDAYQVNLAHRLSASFTGRTRPIFESLIAAADPWHGGYLEFSHANRRFAVASASPELFLSFDPATRRVESRPMKGTVNAPSNAAPILSSEKDHAELDMIIDLVRNDLSRSCDLGSVRVESRRAIERHAGALGPDSLYQAVATVAGRLRDDASLATLLDGAFPGGSITGAPKIRAMQIIDELEPTRRGPYGGAVGYMDFAGNMDTCIALRTMVWKNGTYDVQAGAGVVADSVPASEWQETMDKAKAMLKAVEIAQSGF